MRRLLPLLLLSLVAGFVTFGQVAHADVNQFTITSFSSDQTITNADRQGELRIIETIQVDFSDQNHGIIRAIPLRYKNSPLGFHLNSITSSSGAPVEVKSSVSNNNQILKIGDADRTVTGSQEYTIDYNMHNVISFYNDHDELYWDVNGDQWAQPATRVSITLHLPPGLTLIDQAPRCFAGSYGATGADGCQISANAATLTAQASNLKPYQTLTYVAGFKTGYFQPPSILEKLRDRLATIIELVAPPLIAFIAGFSWWLKRGRDARGRGTIVPQYDAPKDLPPLFAGAIIDFKVDARDITATYIDLARRGYIKIVESRQDRVLLKDKISYSLQLIKTDLSALSVQESDLLTAMFSELTVDKVVQLDDMKSKLSVVSVKLRRAVDSILTKQQYFKHSTYKYAGISSIFGIAFIIAIFTFGHSGTHIGMLIAGMIIGLLIFMLFVRIMPARTAKGVAAKEHLLGLKLYMETAEKDRYEKLEAPDAPYASNAGAPQRTVELFEKLLPYAIALGVETQWATKFNDIYKTPPSWYVGTWTAFNAGYLTGSLSSGFAPALNSTFAAPSSSGSSGFSGGGGFAGGGGGGGGGGGW